MGHPSITSASANIPLPLGRKPKGVRLDGRGGHRPLRIDLPPISAAPFVPEQLENRDSPECHSEYQEFLDLAVTTLHGAADRSR